MPIKCPIKRREYNLKNKEAVAESQKKYQLKNKEKIKEYQSKYRLENKEEISKQRKEYALKNADKIKEYQSKYRLENKEELLEYAKNYHYKNYQKKENKKPEVKNKEKVKDSKLKNKKPPKPAPTQEEVEAKIASQKEYQREYHKNRRKTDPLFNLAQCLRSRTDYAFKVEGYKKTIKTEQLLGADFEIVKNHLENLFTEGMSWENHGEWEIDHIIPFASAETEEDLKSLCHYKNLQPLWKKDNREKGKKV